MKNILLKFLAVTFILSTTFAKDPICYSQTVDWPVGTQNCGAQLVVNGGVPEGFEFVADDPVHSASHATFKCTKKGWKFLSGECSNNPENKNDIPVTPQKKKLPDASK